MSRDCRDKPHKLVGFGYSHPTMPFLDPTWWLKCPANKLRAGNGDIYINMLLLEITKPVIKAKHVVIILNIILIQKNIDLLQNQRIVKLQCVPLEPVR